MDVIDEFAELARRYVALIEESGSLGCGDLVRGCLDLLPALYVLGRRLPEADPREAIAVLERRVSPMANLARVLGERDVYWQVFDPYAAEAPVAPVLSDDLADIYLDLALGLDCFDAGDRNEAVWQWRFNLHAHWGDHLVDALRALHRIAQAN